MWWWDATTRERVTSSWVDLLARDLAPADTQEGVHRLSVNRATRLLERTIRRAGDQQAESQWGMVNRALVANAFKWELLNRGYSRAFADVATEGLVVELARRRRVAKT
jgi:hypothetical protein